jgi:hypothetical protein
MNLLDAITIAVTVVAGGLLALVLWRWYSVPDGDPGIDDDDSWTMRLAIVTLTVWAIVWARLFGLL